MSFWILFIGLSILSYIVSAGFQRRASKYSAMPASYNGAEIAQAMLEDNGIYDVKVVPTRGFLSDHYNPLNKTIALSEKVYYGRSLLSMAVAAHETGHAVQHAQGFFWVKVRSSLVPVVNFASNIGSWLLLAGMFTLHYFPQLMLAGIILFGLSVLFSFITLPVEIDASRRALDWLKTKGLTTGEDYYVAKDALKWAAYTYVMAALTALASLLYYIILFLGATSDD